MLSIATRETVFQAANELKRDGIKPTQTLIRERLGGGSMQTISALLKEWRDEDSAVPDIMDTLPDDIKEVMDKAYEGFVLQVWKATDGHLGREKQALSAELKATNAENERLNRIVNEYETTIDRLTRESSERHQTALAYAEDKRRLEIECQGHLESIRSMTSKYSEAMQNLTRAETERDFHAESSKLQGVQLRGLETLLAATKAELADAKTEIRLKTQELAQAETERQAQTDTIQHLNIQARDMDSRMSKLQIELADARTEARLKIQGLEQELAQAENQRLAQADSIRNLTGQVTTLDVEKSTLARSLEALKADLGQAQKLARELSDENVKIRAELGVQERIEKLLQQQAIQ